MKSTSRLRSLALACTGLLACSPVESTPGDVDATPADVDAAPGDPDAEPAPDAAPPDAAPPRNVVFVSSTAMTAQMGGRDGADATCNQLATAAGLPGTFRAYLSTDAEDAIARIEIARGWVRTDGTPLADAAADIIDGELFNAIRLDETGKLVPVPLTAWTATRNGRRFLAPLTHGTCGNWTTETPPANPDGRVPGTIVGDASHGGQVFSFVDTVACTGRHRLYCFQVDHSTPVAPAPVEARLAFVTKTPWIPAGGLAAADALCQKEATDNAVTGTFKAALPTSGASAASRFRMSDGPWKRKDGVLFMNAADLFDDTKELSAPLNVDLLSKYYGPEQLWAGAAQGWTVVPPNNTTTCTDWTSSDPALITTARRAGIARKATFNARCKDPRQLMCLETAPPAGQ